MKKYNDDDLFELYAITHRGIIFTEEDDKDKRILIDLDILGMGKHIYGDNEIYDFEELKEYFIKSFYVGEDY